MAMPQPRVEGLDPMNYIDLDKLGTANLDTYITFPEMVDGSSFWPNWRGCSATGVAVDYASALIESTVAYPEEMKLTVSNGQLRELDQGWVFYSYQLEDLTTPDRRGEESLRRFFYVGKRAVGGNALPVPQCKESHDLCLDPMDLNSVSIVAVPYRAMQKGDKVTLQLERYFGVGEPFDPLFRSKTLVPDDVGQPLQWSIEASELQGIPGGYCLMSYRVDYADLTVSTTSAQQTLNIIAPTSAPLPALAIKDLTDDRLDPQDWPEGVTVVIVPYPGIQIGDDVLLYVTGGLTSLVKVLKVDPSITDSAILQFSIDYAWLFNNRGRTINLLYQYARVGSAGTSVPLVITLLRLQDLLPPIVCGATPEDGQPGEYKGYIFALNATGGVTIDLPGEVEVGQGDILEMHWEGHPGEGTVCVSPTVGNPRRFKIPATAVPANMGKRVNVFYTLTPSGGTATQSIIYDLEVKPIDGGWPILQAVEPATSNRELPIGQVTDQGARFRLDSWTYMAEGQRVRIRAVGLLVDSTLRPVDLRVGNDELVTEDEYNEGALSVRVPKEFLLSLKLDTENLKITVEISFDDGGYYFPLPDLPDLKVMNSALSVRKK